MTLTLRTSTAHRLAGTTGKAAVRPRELAS
jgi:hypothetical protein